MDRNPYPELIALRDTLAALPGIASCRIGLEPGIVPADYPLIRIVPSTYRRGEGARQELELLVYYGELANDFEAGGIQAQYEWLFATEAAIKDAAIASGVVAAWVDTVLDEDRLPGYKLFASRFRLDG